MNWPIEFAAAASITKNVSEAESKIFWHKHRSLTNSSIQLWRFAVSWQQRNFEGSYLVDAAIVEFVLRNCNPFVEAVRELASWALLCSEYQALPQLNAGASAVAFQMIKLENEGWEWNYAATAYSGLELSEPPLWASADAPDRLTTAVCQREQFVSAVTRMGGQIDLRD